MLRFLLLLATLAFASLANGQTFPKLTGRVVDEAGLLAPPQKALLADKLAALEKESGRQLVIATIPDLQGYEIQDYGYRLLRAWGIGDKSRNDGVVLLISKNDRKIGIETGYGVEGVLTDALSKRIIITAISPRFKTGDFAGGIDAGVDQIAALLKLPPEEAAKRAAEAARAEQDRADDVNPVMVIFWLIVILAIVLPLARRASGGGRSYRGGRGGAPIVLWGPGIGGSGWDNDRGSGGGWGGFGGGGFSDGGGFSGGGGSGGGGGASGDW